MKLSLVLLRGAVVATLALTVAFKLAPLSAAEICAQNATDAPYLFALEVRGGLRKLATLAPATTLCVIGEGTAVVSVFRDMTSIEGCSRLLAPGRHITLEAYADFDRCSWAQ